MPPALHKTNHAAPVDGGLISLLKRPR